ncbi:hypothetical protein mRhiFer1_009907 [Rhinolophus ferrumequinum]|uniref:Uncharacterized protein n=1 Tax=Rhinolophus ferrumequinum TaxID=59479 RepID=A0A7J7YI19_RHIFE|nr:hypothetical protein mRhiFer1_009907 [Rhinolophus ferrumequinum]
MQSWKNPSGRRGAGAGAALPPSPACRGGAALGPCPGALFAGGEGGRGRQKMPGGKGWAGLGTGSQSPRALDAVRQPARGAHPMISAAGEGGHTRGTRNAAHGHLAAAAACGGRPLGGAHRPGNGADACAPAHTRSFTRSCAQTRELPAAPWIEGRNGSHRRGGGEIDALYGGPGGQIQNLMGWGGALEEAPKKRNRSPIPAPFYRCWNWASQGSTRQGPAPGLEFPTRAGRCLPCPGLVNLPGHEEAARRGFLFFVFFL